MVANLPGYDAFMIRLLRRAQKTAKMAPPTRQIPSTPSAMPDIQDDAQPPEAGSVL